MLFGYALAVVTGFLVNRLPRRQLVLLALLWLLARIAFLIAPSGLPAVLSNTAFAVAVALIVAPRFMKAAKKWRNRLIAPLVLAICSALTALGWTMAGRGGYMTPAIIGTAVLLFALLMLFFGGRLIAPAAAGAIEASGGRLDARVQPRLEGALILAMLATVVIRPLAGTGNLADALVGMALIASGLLALIRLLRWRLWQCVGRMDLLCLGSGYAWLGIGLLLIGWRLLLGLGPPIAVATHAITVGALGTLTCNIMARTRLLQHRIAPVERAGRLVTITALMSTAAGLRMVGSDQTMLLLVAAGCWSAAQFTLLSILLETTGPSGQRTRAERV